MNVITLASRKGGSGKSTLTAHLAAFAHKLGHRSLILDADPQGSLTLWHSLRADRQPPLENAARGIDRLIAHAMIDGVEWVFIDTAPTLWVVVQEAIRAATLVVIPARPGFFDLAAVTETVKIARERTKPYAVVINSAPVKRDEKKAPAVAASRAKLDAQRLGHFVVRRGRGSILEGGEAAVDLGCGEMKAARQAGGVETGGDLFHLGAPAPGFSRFAGDPVGFPQRLRPRQLPFLDEI